LTKLELTGEVLSVLEEWKMEAERCLLDSKGYSTGSQVCEEKRCFVCEDGHWRERFIDRVFGVGP